MKNVPQQLASLAYAGLIGLAFLAPSSATAITVQEIGVSPTEIVTISVPGFYTGGVYAGVNKLVVDGVAMDGFCIDPFHFSLASSPDYSFVSLVNAPKPPGGPMGADKALTIEKLWTLFYSPTMTAPDAAGLQIAIWEVVGIPNFQLTSGNDFGAAGDLAAALAYNGPVRTLLGLTGPGQDYIIAVADGGTTLLLLAGSLIGMFVFAIIKKERLCLSVTPARKR